MAFALCWGDVIRSTFIRTGPWLGVFMALIRYLVVKNPLDPKFEKLCRAKTGLITVSLTTLLSTLICSLKYSRQDIKSIEWVPPEECLGYPENYTEREHHPSFPIAFWLDPIFGYFTFRLIEGGLKVLLSVVLPILTILLVKELGAAKKKRQKLSSTESSKPDHTTKMITLMTAATLMAEGPIGVFFVIESIFSNHDGIQ